MLNHEFLVHGEVLVLDQSDLFGHRNLQIEVQSSDDAILSYGIGLFILDSLMLLLVLRDLTPSL